MTFKVTDRKKTKQTTIVVTDALRVKHFILRQHHHHQWERTQASLRHQCIGFHDDLLTMVRKQIPRWRRPIAKFFCMTKIGEQGSAGGPVEGGGGRSKGEVTISRTASVLAL